MINELIEKFKVGGAGYNFVKKTLIGKGKSFSTIRKYCILLNLILKKALKLNFISLNPFDDDDVKIPANVIEKTKKPIESQELALLQEKIYETNEILFKYCLLIYLTGLRPVDLKYLSFENIAIENGVKCFAVKDHKLRLFNRTTYIPILPAVEKIYLQNRDNGYIFEYNGSRENLVASMSKKFKKICNKYTPIQFRHTFASELSNKDVNETHINFLLGKLPEGTLKNYLWTNMEIIRNDIFKLPCDFDFYREKKLVDRNDILRFNDIAADSVRVSAI
ncbi:hypothetical protein KA977_07625 [Candidatus Dependentiae bacterium]|nr:hypothetical protein [Candidatus Dependentiae bacterium]